jgi:hypothetical protein
MTPLPSLKQMYTMMSTTATATLTPMISSACKQHDKTCRDSKEMMATKTEQTASKLRRHLVKAHRSQGKKKLITHNVTLHQRVT